MYSLVIFTLDENAVPVAPATFIASSATQGGVQVLWDDFTFDREGNAFVATENGNGIQKVTPKWAVSVVAGNLNTTELAEPTSAIFGRTLRDQGVLYVTTAGGIGKSLYQDGQRVIVGAQIVAVDVGAGSCRVTLNLASSFSRCIYRRSDTQTAPVCISSGVPPWFTGRKTLIIQVLTHLICIEETTETGE
ncbi:hypothetical protein BKA61DRAFT_188260 [Leptodontidium sp. MPI-SDFR-AT-0119]|nr:hypothetical protein BKA61DRAFT_188260 [Leptodontidium sp. MPI-SDFR-AT-0119]